MFQVALFFGSFNPVHMGHLIIAQQLFRLSYVQEIWFVLSPQNPHKSPDTLLADKDRLCLLQSALSEQPHFKVCAIELDLPRPSYSIDTLQILRQKYTHHFSILCGSDTYLSIPSWKQGDEILKKYAFFVYERPGQPLAAPYPSGICYLNQEPLLQLSASYIRQLIKEQKDLCYLVPPSVEEIITAKGYYRSLSTL